MNILGDDNLNRHAIILFLSIANQGWFDIIPIRFVTLKEIALIC